MRAFAAMLLASLLRVQATRAACTIDSIWDRGIAISVSPAQVAVGTVRETNIALGYTTGAPGADAYTCTLLPDGTPAAMSRVVDGRTAAGPVRWLLFSAPQRNGSIPGATVRIDFSSPSMDRSRLSRAVLRGNLLIIPGAGAPLSKARAATFPSLPGTQGLRIGIARDGIYEISGGDLNTAGVPIHDVLSRTYRLFSTDGEVPIHITNAHRESMQRDDRILFYATMLYDTVFHFTQYSNTNVYWLTWNNGVGARMATVFGGKRRNELQYVDPSEDTLRLIAGEFFDTLHIEQDNDIRWLGSIEEPQELVDTAITDEPVDNWYWGFVGDNSLTTYSFSVPSPSDNGTARIRVALRGLTDVDNEPIDHQYSILLNNNPVDPPQTYAQWNGQNEYVYTSTPFPAGRLVHGKNIITFAQVQRSFPDRAALNWIEVMYPRTFKALDNAARFAPGPRDTGALIQFNVPGFSTSDLDLWDIRHHRIFTDFSVTRRSEKGQEPFTLTFQDSVFRGAQYLAQARTRRLTPRSLLLETVNASFDTLAGVDYLIVAPDSFTADLQPLVDWHTRQGRSVGIVDISDVYNRFSFGIKNPESIRSLVKYLFALAPGDPPRWLLLAGDTSHDLDKKNRELNIVPTHLTRIPGWGPSSSDTYFVTVAGEDQFADMFVGRLPVRNRRECRLVVDKTVAYHQNLVTGAWRDNVLLLGGYDESSIFTQFNDDISNEIGPAMRIIRFDGDPGSPFYRDRFTASGAIADRINAGTYAVNFNGHGGGNIWSDSRFFSWSDLGRLYNDQWEIAASCPSFSVSPA